MRIVLRCGSRNGVSAYVISALIALQLFPTPTLGAGAATFLEANRADLAPDSMKMLRSIARDLRCTTTALLHVIWRVPTLQRCYPPERYSFSGRLEGILDRVERTGGWVMKSRSLLRAQAAGRLRVGRRRT
jgi:hypothetical protein